jgi:hypothetical protein
MTKREAERLLQWLDDACSDDLKDRPGIYLSRAVRDALSGVKQPPS